VDSDASIGRNIDPAASPELPRESSSKASATDREPMLYCPVCSLRLAERKCKLYCERCGYYMSCADYY
jgi:hypothetical protein